MVRQSREREREMDEPRGCGFLMVAGLVGEAWNLFLKKNKERSLESSASRSARGRWKQLQARGNANGTD